MASYVRREKFRAQLLAMELGSLVAGAIGGGKATRGRNAGTTGRTTTAAGLVKEMGIVIS